MPWLQLRSAGRLWYEEQGEGIPLLFLHGWCMSSAVWQQQWRYFSSSYRVIALDLPGHGRSDAAGILTLDSGVAVVDEFCTALDLNNLILCGWSLGSLLALQSVCSLGERLCGIVVTGVTPKFVCSDDWLFGLALRDVEGLAVAYRRNSRKARDSFAARMFSEQERKNHDLMSSCAAIFAEIPVPSPHVALQGLEILVNSDIRPLLPAITLPLLVISGDSDAICLPAAARMVVETVADGKLVEFNGCGHVPFLARPETWNEVAGCFFRGICAKSHR